MWSNVIGQQRAKHILTSAVTNGKLPGAYLFSGPEGIGKDAAAIQLAKQINCLNPSPALPLSKGRENDLQACDECASCETIANFTSPALHFIHALPKKEGGDGEETDLKDVDVIREQVAAKAADAYHNLDIPRATTISVAQIRELRQMLSRSFTGGKKRIVIISEADMMNAQAQNAFLKTLEEPHADTLIIMTSSNAHKLLPTIHSRCQDVRFDVLTIEEIAGALTSRDDVSSDDAVMPSRMANGSYAMARSFIGQDLRTIRDKVIDFVARGVYGKSPNYIAKDLDTFIPRSGAGKYLEQKQAVELRLAILNVWLRDALAVSTGAEHLVVNYDLLNRLQRFAKLVDNPKRLAEALVHVERAAHQVRLQLRLRPVMHQLAMELGSTLLGQRA